MSHNKYKQLQDLVDNYLDSGLSAREYVEACVDAGDITAAEALKLLSVLREAQSVTFKLSEVTGEYGDPGLHMALTRKGEEFVNDKPLFTISLDESLDPDREEVIDLLQSFAKDLAVLATQAEPGDAEAIDPETEAPEEWLDHPNIMPASGTRH